MEEENEKEKKFILEDIGLEPSISIKSLEPSPSLPNHCIEESSNTIKKITKKRLSFSLSSSPFSSQFENEKELIKEKINNEKKIELKSNLKSNNNSQNEKKKSNIINIIIII